MDSSKQNHPKNGQSSEPVRLLIADGLDIMRFGLRVALGAMPNFEVVADCADGESAVKLALRLKPDLVIMDLNLPILDGISALTQIKSQAPKTLALISTNHDDSDLVLAALGAG